MIEDRQSEQPPPPTGAGRQRGVRVFRLYAALAFSFAWVPVMYTAFVLERGFSPGDYARLWSVYYAVMVLAELPWGWLADRWGPRPLLAAGPLLLAGAFCVLGRASEFNTCLLAMGLTGAAHAMISGADSAWLYDFIQAQGRSGDALHEEAAAHRWRLLGVCLADVAGGVVAFFLSTRAAFDLAALLMLGAALAARCLPASGPRRARASTTASLQPTRLLSDLRRPGVAWCLAWFALVFVLLRVGFQLYQPTLLEQGVASLWQHGLVFGLLNLLAGLAAFGVRPVHDRLGEVGSALAVLVMLGVAFLGLGLGPAWWLLPMLAIQQVSFSFLQPLGRTALNRRVPSRDRAWLLSVQSVGGRLAFAAVLWSVDAELALGDLPRSYAGLALAALLGALLLGLTAPRRVGAAAGGKLESPADG